MLSGEVVPGLKVFCLERWQSLNENSVKVNLSESGVAPLSIQELENMGLDFDELKRQSLGYGWTNGSENLRAKISELYNNSVKSEEILITSGSAESNFVSSIAIANRNDLIAIDIPNYMQTFGILKWIGANTIEINRDKERWNFPIEKAIEVIENKKPKALFICDPNNPTTKVMKEKEIVELGDAARRARTLLVFDEVYLGSEKEERPSAIEILGTDIAVVISGLSKVYGLPGLRIGWIAASKELISRAWAIKDYVSIAPSILSDFIASQILTMDNVRFLRTRAKKIAEVNFEIIKEETKSLVDIVPMESGAFVWAKLLEEKSSMDIALELLNRYSILVNPGECFETPGYLRIGVGQKSEEFKKSVKFFADALKSILLQSSGFVI